MAQCATCGGVAQCKPLDGCTEPKHATRFKTRSAANNQYRKDRRAKARAAGAVYRSETPEAKKAQSKRDYARRRAAIMDRLGGACTHCQFSNPRALEVHHRDGGGNAERERLGWRYHLRLFKLPTDELRRDFELLCANCHAIEHSSP